MICLQIYLSYFLKKAIKLGKIEISLVSTNSPPIGNKNFNLLLFLLCYFHFLLTNGALNLLLKPFNQL